MENKVCFMFGHAFADNGILSDIEAAAERHYTQHGIRTFIVGNRGSFDGLAASAVKHLKHRHSDITLLLLLAYHPGERSFYLSEGFDGSYYPPLERVPRQYAIIKANRHMIDTADTMICYVCSPGNTRKLLDYARRRTEIPIDNIAITHPAPA